MPKLPKGPLKDVQDEGNTLNEAVTELLKECTTVLEDSTIKNRPAKLRDLHGRCVVKQKEVKTLLEKSELLEKKNEQSKVKNFETTKDSEVKRLKGLDTQLEAVVSKLVPDEVEEAYYKKIKENDISTADDVTEEEDEEEDEEDEETEVEEDDDDEEEEEEDEEEEEEGETEEDEGVETEEGSEEEANHVQYQALSTFEKEQPDDLGFVEGDILTLIVVREDGWWECEDKDGNRGLVPSTYLQEYNKYQDIQSPENEDDEDEENVSPRSGKALWSSIKKAVKETSATDVLHAMGAVPAGFRQSTLAKLLDDGDEYTMKNYLTPKLSSSNLSFKDLFFNPTTNKIRVRPVRVQRILTLQACRQIPMPGTEPESPDKGLQIISRHVRICLFDGKKVLSNIVTIKAHCTEKDQRTWNFQNKISDNMSSLDFGEVFIRSNRNETSLGILVELGMTYKRQKTQEMSECSCGWVNIPIYNTDGTPVANKNFDLMVNGGTPYEKGIEVDPTISRRVTSNPLRSLMSKNKQPRFVFKISLATKEQKELLESLPDVLVGSTAHLMSLSFYRQILADMLLRDKIEANSTELVHSPFLAIFPSVAEQPDLMDVIRNAWTEKVRITKKAEKRDNEHMKQQFRQVFMETAYPLQHISSIPPFKLVEETNGHRQEEINKVMQQTKDKKTVLASLLSPDFSHTPFEISELSYDVLGEYCLCSDTT